MTSKEFRLDDLQALDCYRDGDDLVPVETTEWIQDGKYQNQTTVFYHKDFPDEFYSWTVFRSGSPFSDWTYDWGNVEKPDMVKCYRVHKVIKTIETWE